MGGTKIAAALIDSERETDPVQAQQTIPTEAHVGPDGVLDRAAELVRALCHTANLPLEAINGIGFGLPAVIDFERGTTLLLPNLPGDWNQKPVARELSQRTQRPVWLINDARAFTLAEANFGAGRGAETVVCFTVGTGIGGGIALRGQLHLGADGRAGEFGHQTIDPHGPLCGCGNIGCLEALASGPAITAMGVKIVLQGTTTLISGLVEQDIRRITPEIILRAAELGDAGARDILQRAGTALGTGIANVITLLSPNRVVLGGGVMALGEWLLGPARAVIQKRCTTAPIHKIELVRASLGNYAGAIGAAVWAMQQHSTIPGTVTGFGFRQTGQASLTPTPDVLL